MLSPLPRLAALVVLIVPGLAVAEATPADAVPDLTRSLDFERKGEFHLGPTGAKGWMHTNKKFMTTGARQILVTGILPGSPAEGKLRPGDVILGLAGAEFSSDARRALGHAINRAEREENEGRLDLLRWRPDENESPRQGTTSTVTLTLPVMGSYSATSPWDCPKSERILKQALDHLLAQKDFGRFGVNALALLATGEPQLIRKVRDYLHQQDWAGPGFKIGVEKGGMVSWACGYRNLLLTEYFLLTGDEHVLPAIREHALKTAMGQSHGGTWGHGFAWTSINDGQLHGKLPGYGALNQAGLPCYLSLLLAKKCGVEHPEIEAAITRASDFFSEFIGHGSICYGYHRPSLEIHASGRNGLSGNGKNALAALAFQVEGHDEGRRFFSRLTASLSNTCEYGHSGNSYSYFWDPFGANVGGPHLVTAFLKELQWYYALTRLPDGSFVNQPLGGHYGGTFLDPTAAQVLIATLPRRILHLTGKDQKEDTWLDQEEVEITLRSGRWRLADREAMSPEDLLADLGDWSPIAREWAALTLATKEGDFTTRLRQLLQSRDPHERAGACAAVGHWGERAAGLLPDLAAALADEDDRVAIAAGYALARLGEQARAALPDLMRALVLTPDQGSLNPRQQALGYAFGHVRARTAPLYFEGLLARTADQGNPLAGLDRPLLYATLETLLNNPNGRVRGCGAYAFRYFDRRDVAHMAQEIYDAVTIPTMSHMMFADAPRAEALDLLARFNLQEGIPLALETFDFGSWGAYARFPARFRTLRAYGGSARPWLPQLREMRSRWKQGKHREDLEKTILAIEKDDDPAPLESLHDLVDERLANDLAVARVTGRQQLPRCRKWMKKHRADFFYQAACLRRIVALAGSQASRDLEQALESPSEILCTTARDLQKTLPTN